MHTIESINRIERQPIPTTTARKPTSMAKNLLTKRQHHLVVWNRDGAKAQALAAEFPGRVTVAATAKEAVATAQVRGVDSVCSKGMIDRCATAGKGG